MKTRTLNWTHKVETRRPTAMYGMDFASNIKCERCGGNEWAEGRYEKQGAFQCDCGHWRDEFCFCTDWYSKH